MYVEDYRIKDPEVTHNQRTGVLISVEPVTDWRNFERDLIGNVIVNAELMQMNFIGENLEKFRIIKFMDKNYLDFVNLHMNKTFRFLKEKEFKKKKKIKCAKFEELFKK